MLSSKCNEVKKGAKKTHETHGNINLCECAHGFSFYPFDFEDNGCKRSFHAQ